jgi:putative ATP-dependent endonuclease of OLD family
MYISKLIIEGFRNFPRTEIMFNDGVNVLIGHNNAGKTSLLKAIGLVINTEASKRLEIDDLYKNVQLVELKVAPPKVVITMFIQQSKEERLDSEDLVTISGFLIKLEEPYMAQLTYTYFLPPDKAEDYKKSLAEVADIEEAWQTIKHEFLRFYVHRIFGGDPALQNTADGESLAKFDYQFLNAIRDVERDMFTGRNTLLRDVIHFFMDYQVKSDTAKDEKAKNAEIKQRRKDFTIQAGELLKILHRRMEGGKEEILSYAHQTGATFNNAKPDFDGTISDVEMYSALRLIIGYEALSMKIPATHNGLGYNNLIFMSLLLAKMQVNSDGTYLGSNAKVFPILVIEEPEAHLHPAMQYKFLSFLKENLTSKKVRQVFVSTHSTQITSAVSLDDIICLHNENGVVSVGYPGKVFPDTEHGQVAKAYVQRFLDATRSDMLFAQKIIFVEGLAEQLLIPTFARYCGQQLEDHHIAIIPVGGRFFDNFLYLFDSRQPHTLPKKVVCLKDRDPERRDTNARSFSSCYPYAYNHAPAKYTYREHLSGKITEYQDHRNILFKGQHHLKGKTFEYELCLQNLADIIIPPSISNRDELLELIEGYHASSSLEQLFDMMRTSEGSTAIIDALTAANDTEWSHDDKKKALIASRYLQSVGKGENALQLAGLLEANLLLPVALPVGADPATTPLQKAFNVPTYIQEAISWICQ